MDDLFGTKKETSVNYLPEQIKDIQETNKFKTGVVRPGMERAFQAGENVYQQSLPGVYKAAQNVAGVAGQAQKTAGETGESMLRTGAQGLGRLFSKDYEQNQINAALAPVQGQYLQNLAGQQAQFGAAGNLGSARQALAGQQMIGANAMNQAMLAAQIQKDIAGQRQDVGKYMTGAGQAGLGQAVGYGQAGYGAATAPQAYTNQYMQGQYAMPAGMFQAQYPGQQGSQTSETPSLFNIGSSLFGMISDARLKENIKYVKSVDGVNVYSYNYTWDDKPQLGAMAQELLGTKYDSAVIKHDSGFYMVNYAKLPKLH